MQNEKLQLGISVQSINCRGWNALKIVWTRGSMISNNPWWSSAFAWDHIRACLLCVATTVDDQQTFACTPRLIRPDGLLTERKRERLILSWYWRTLAREDPSLRGDLNAALLGALTLMLILHFYNLRWHSLPCKAPNLYQTTVSLRHSAVEIVVWTDYIFFLLADDMMMWLCFAKDYDALMMLWWYLYDSMMMLWWY